MKINFKGLMLRLVVFFILIYVAVTIINQQKKIDSYDISISNLNDEIIEENEYKAELISTKENINSQEYIERVAREKLNMYKPNEKVYIDIRN